MKKKTPQQQRSIKNKDKERALIMELLNEHGAKCMTCNRNALWHPISGIVGLSHIVARSRGGKTDSDNCILECQGCHSLFEKKPHMRPRDSIGYQLYIAQLEEE